MRKLKLLNGEKTNIEKTRGKKSGFEKSQNAEFDEFRIKYSPEKSQNAEFDEFRIKYSPVANYWIWLQADMNTFKARE